MPKATLTWRAHLDDATCPICVALHGYAWIFEMGELGTTVSTVQGGFRTFLIHPEYGVVWDIMQGSKAHGHQRYNCRCNVSSEIDVSDLKQRVEAIYEKLKVSLH